MDLDRARRKAAAGVSSTVRARASAKLERLLGGVESVRLLSASVRERLGSLKRDPRTPHRLKERIRQAEKIWEHERDNNHPFATCADRLGRKIGPAARGLSLMPTEDPSDRAHNIRDTMKNLLPAAVGRRGKWPSGFHSEARLYLESDLRPVRMMIEGKERTVLVGPDTHEETIADRGEEIRKAMGVDLIGRSMAAAVENALNRGGDAFVERVARGIHQKK